VRSCKTWRRCSPPEFISSPLPRPLKTGESVKIEDVFRKLKPLAERDMDILWQEYILADAKVRKNIEAVLRLLLARNLRETFEGREILLEPPPQDLARGEYPLGTVYYGSKPICVFGLREKEWIQHVGIFGRSGSGKTNVAFLVVMNLLRHGKPFMIFDWKRNYRDLLRVFPDRFLIFTVGRAVSPFYFNPLKPPGSCPATVWLKKIIEILCHAYFLGEGVAYLFQKAIDSVYREFGVYEGSGYYPTLADVRDWLESYQAKGRESAWMDSAMRAVGVLCFGEVGKVLNSRVEMPLEELLERNVILELDALTNSDKTFLIESLLLWLHHYRLGQAEKEVFKHAVIIEEAHHILMRKKQEVMGEEAVTDIILREIRELGEAVILIDQHPSLISKPALGNTYCTVAMNLKHRADVAMMADSLLLDAERTRYLGKLNVGEAMVKLQGRWLEPFLVRFPLVKVRKGSVSDEDVAKAMKAWMEAFMPREKLLDRISQASRDFRPFRTEEKPQEDKPKNLGVSALELKALQDLVEVGFSSTWERYERLGLNAYQGNKLRQSLLEKGLIEVKDLATPTGRIKYWVLTDKAREVLRQAGINPNSSHRKGGPEHAYWQRRIALALRELGYRVTEEYPIGGGRSIDLVAVKDGVRIAIEVETGKSEVVHNLRKALDAGFDRVVCVVLDEKLVEKIAEKAKRLIDSDLVTVIPTKDLFGRLEKVIP